MIGLSIGLVLFPTLPGQLDEILKQADRALYEAKFAGKNRVAFLAD